ncbi:methyltransferase domain-containing protein [Pelolinea submarina]|uniref:Trans-aconitate methyltransferase n=1 Tax=Pelolinea submarina TaxID=913107 RepID=A0A347ZPM8_9CHLR|nr:methyltransferase domain-containing protein [Pelolinea submarina]REG04726.1 trans-aconitate methyltransferase [Pelolinea submarina]BBB47259.1 trans-aconitate 2-methyltransferase [Pelolinea submarina]
MKWDSGLYDNKHGFVAEFGKGLLEFIPRNMSQRILDIGCGTGALTAQLASQCGYVLGIDSSLEMVEKAKEQFPDIDFQVMDALALSYEHEWDVVFSNAVFHWIPDHDRLLNKIQRSLKPSSKLICEFGAQGNIETIERAFIAAFEEIGHTYRSKFNFPSVVAFSALLRKNGFLIDKVTDFDRPTPLKDGEQGLINWARQFFAAELEMLTDEEQDKLLQKMQSTLKDKLWNGQEWVADYRRLRAVAHTDDGVQL